MAGTQKRGPKSVERKFNSLVDGAVARFSTGEEVHIDDLTRPELSLVAKGCFGHAIDGRDLLYVTNDVIRQAIREYDPNLITATAAVRRAASAAPAAEAPTAEAPETSASAPAPAGGGLEQAILDLVRARVGVDEAAVRRIAQEVVEAALAHRVPRDLHIHVPGREVTKIEGRTHKVLPKVIAALAAGEHVFLVGPAGSGKSTVAYQAFQALGLRHESISLGPTTPTSKLFGFMDASGRFHETGFYRAFTGGGGFLVDELDNGHPGLVAELNQALANGRAAFADGEHERHPDHRFVATGNTYGRGADRLFVGRNILDAATLDRFTTIEVDYDEDLEREVALACATPETYDAAVRWVDRVQRVRAAAAERRLPVVISPRASIAGVRLLATGEWTENEVAATRLFAGLSADVRDQIDV